MAEKLTMDKGKLEFAVGFALEQMQGQNSKKILQDLVNMAVLPSEEAEQADGN